MNEKFNLKIDTIRAFLPKNRTLFSIFQKGRVDGGGGGSPLSPLVSRVLVWLNMHQYPWISLNILENRWICCSDYARALNIHDHLTCFTVFWRCLRFSISQGSEYGTVVYAMVTQSSEYVWLWLDTPQKCLNIPQYALISFNTPKHG